MNEEFIRSQEAYVASQVNLHYKPKVDAAKRKVDQGREGDVRVPAIFHEIVEHEEDILERALNEEEYKSYLQSYQSRYSLLRHMYVASAKYLHSIHMLV